MNFNQIKAKIKGNVVPVPAQLNSDFSLNLSGFRDHAQFLVDKHVNVFYLALSASEFEYMTTKERILVTKAVADVVGDKGIILAQAIAGGWIEEQIEEARAMLDAGADAIVVKPVGIKEGGKFFSCKYLRGSYSSGRHDDHFVRYMEQFSGNIKAPLVYHDKPFSNGLGLSMEGLQRIIEIENVVCLKVHVPDPCVMQDIYGNFGTKVACFDGFGKSLQFWSLIWGATARHTCWSWFDPLHDKEFFDSVKSGDYAKAVALLNKEWPLAHTIRQTGFAGYKEVMRILGLPSGPVRIPGEELNEPQKKMIEHAVREIGLLV